MTINEKFVTDTAEEILKACTEQTTAEVLSRMKSLIDNQPPDVVVMINTRVKDDSRYVDATRRIAGWTSAKKASLSWTHLSKQGETDLRAAAAWRSLPPSFRLEDDPRQALSAAYNHRAVENLWGGVTVWFKKSLDKQHAPTWPEEARAVLSAGNALFNRRALFSDPDDRHIRFSSDGFVLEGLPTWPR